MTRQQENPQLPVTLHGTSDHPGQPSAALLERARHGWDSFLARCQAPGESGSETDPAGEPER